MLKYVISMTFFCFETIKCSCLFVCLFVCLFACVSEREREREREISVDIKLWVITTKTVHIKFGWDATSTKVNLHSNAISWSITKLLCSPFFIQQKRRNLKEWSLPFLPSPFQIINIHYSSKINLMLKSTDDQKFFKWKIEGKKIKN